MTLIVWVGGCQFDNQPPNGQQRCAPGDRGQRCPDGYTCQFSSDGDERCYRRGTGPDLPSRVDAGDGKGIPPEASIESSGEMYSADASDTASVPDALFADSGSPKAGGEAEILQGDGGTTDAGNQPPDAPSCGDGMRRCGDECISQAHPVCCSSQDCSQGSDNSVGQCDENVCVYSCARGFKPCNLACVPEAFCCSDADCDSDSNGRCATLSGECSYTRRLVADPNQSGTGRNDGTISKGSFAIGEDNDSTVLGRGFLTFDLSVLPNNITLLEADLFVYQALCLNDPFTNGHGDLLAEHLPFGVLSNNSYMAPSLGLVAPSPVVFSDSIGFGWRSTDITTWVQWDLENPEKSSNKSQQRFRFEVDGVVDGVSRRCSWVTVGSADEPYLEVTFELP